MKTFFLVIVIFSALSLGCESKKVSECKESCMNEGIKLRVPPKDINICREICVKENGNWNAQDHYLKHRP